MRPKKSGGDKKRVSLYLDPKLYERIVALTDKEGMTINGFFTVAAEKELKIREDN